MPEKLGSQEKQGMSNLKLFFILAVPVMLLAALAAAQTVGAVDIIPYLRQIPVVGTMIPKSDPAKQGSQQTLEEARIARLEAEKADLDAKLTEVQSKATTPVPQDSQVLKEKADLEKQVADLKNQIDKENHVKLDTQKLAERLSAMKPASAAKIMENLPDDTVNSLLNQMDIDVAAKITAALDPVRAARLTMPTGGEDQETRQKADADLKRSQLSKANYQNIGKSLAAMKVEDAAAVIEQLPDDISVSILCEMDQTATGKILSELASINPERAARLVALMGRTV
ncbi:hypothetical protein GJ688_02215 [Heliobacillus mobilis]|uniref:Magnesium transporter MgtE intracellular domain-containing protein n=1 Tax=Heliobacterium mobile TaxID=28064 RepID=A0A6I3SBS1_HELMO|nr:hypothetical protein [Heliobacterium mobile]MTV47798.1 hypothetical protein [Heliobacterium mobile]